MDDQHGLLTLAAYLTATMLIVLVACLGIFYYGAAPRVPALESNPSDPVPEFAVTQLDLTPNAVGQSSTLAALDQQRIRLLETMLSEKTERLREQSELIARQASDLEELKKRYDDVMSVAAASLEQDPTGDMEGAEQGAAVSDEAADPARLEAELSMARAVHEALVSDLESMQDELVRAYEELERWQEESNRESGDRLRDGLILEAASADVLSRIGSDAVPALRDSLTHTSPVVRRWAATVLGGIGPGAGNAVGR